MGSSPTSSIFVSRAGVLSSKERRQQFGQTQTQGFHSPCGTIVLALGTPQAFAYLGCASLVMATVQREKLQFISLLTRRVPQSARVARKTIRQSPMDF